MSIEVQWILVGLIVAGAASYLVRAGWRSLRGTKAGCGGGCGCSGKTPAGQMPALIPSKSLSLRQRKTGEN
jgi:FeoB-associated Cys-rich membrane protein